MSDVLSRIQVNVPLDAAFVYYSNQDRLQEWIPGDGILEFAPLMPPPKRPGSRYRMVYRSFGFTFHLVAELTKLEKNKLSEMRQVTGDYKSFQYDMHFVELGPGATELTMRIKAVLPWGILGRMAAGLTQSQALRDVNGVLLRFKKAAETASNGQQHEITS